MNAAISSSVVLASRLPSDLSVFGLMLVSVQLFALFPMLRRRLQVIPTSFSALSNSSRLTPHAPGRACYCSDVRHIRTVPVCRPMRRLGIPRGDCTGYGSVRSRYLRGTGRPRVGTEIQEVRVDHAEALGVRELIWLLARSGGLGTRQCPGLIERRSPCKAMRLLSPVVSELRSALLVADWAEGRPTMIEERRVHCIPPLLVDNT